MAESFFVPKTTKVFNVSQQSKIKYHNRNQFRKNKDSKQKDFNRALHEDTKTETLPEITPEKLCKKILPNCFIYLIDYEMIRGLRLLSYPLDIFFQEKTVEKSLQEVDFLNLQGKGKQSEQWLAMIQRCKGNAILIHPQQWKMMGNDLEYAVMLLTQARSILAKEYGGNIKYPNKICNSCLIGIDRFGVVIRLYSTGNYFGLEGESWHKIQQLRKNKTEKSIEELKENFMEKLRRQKIGFEKYRYNNLVMQRLQHTSKLFEQKSKEAEIGFSEFQSNDISLSLMELLTGGL